MKYSPLITAILWGLCYTSTGFLTKTVDVKVYLFFSCLLSTCAFLIWGLADGSFLKPQDFANNYHWIALSSLCSFFACFFSVNAVKYCGASTAAMIEISYPLWVILFTFMLRGESNLNFNTILGGLLILAGTYIVIKGG